MPLGSSLSSLEEPQAETALEVQDRTGNEDYDAIVIGSGFGGTMAAQVLVDAGQRVLMLERGDWVRRGPHNWESSASMHLTPYYTSGPGYRVEEGRHIRSVRGCHCVGGPSVFYGGVSLRFREADFLPHPALANESTGRWPLCYAELEPFYSRAEALLHVAGEAGLDPTEPYHSAPYAQAPAPLSPTAERIRDAGLQLRLAPFRLPLAISYSPRDGQAPCRSCTTCDTFACAVGAKNDLATTLLPALIRRGMFLRANTVARRLICQGRRVTAVEACATAGGAPQAFRARQIILAAGALATPHLLLASDLHRHNPAGHLIGCNLMRHCSAIVFGVFPWRPNATPVFHKQLAFNDYYFGDPEWAGLGGKLGHIQQLPTPPLALVQSRAPAVVRPLLGPAVDHLTGLLVMAEDQPEESNHLGVDWSARDGFGLPQPVIRHQYTQRDRAARRALVRRAKQILRRAGALFFHVHEIDTFSHAIGTVRMGEDPARSPLDPHCRFRGLDNLYVVDASVLPSAASVNPSLTIAANALRVAERLAGQR